MRLINLTYVTFPEEIKQELAVNSFIEGLRDPETSQTVRMARLKKLSETLAYALQFEIAKQTSRNQERLKGESIFPGIIARPMRTFS